MGKLVVWLDRCLLTDLPTGRPCFDVDHLMFVEAAVCARRGFKRQKAVVSFIQEVFSEWNTPRRQQGLSDEYVPCHILVVDPQYFDGGTDL